MSGHRGLAMQKLAKRKGEVVEMVDGRVYFSSDNWQTATLVDDEGRITRLTGTALDFARFLAISQASWAGNAS